MNIFQAIFLFSFAYFTGGLLGASPLPPHSICAIEGKVINVEITDQWLAGWNDNGEFVQEFTKSAPFTKVTIQLDKRDVAEAKMIDSCSAVIPGQTDEVYQSCGELVDLSAGQIVRAHTQIMGDEHSGPGNCLKSVEIIN